MTHLLDSDSQNGHVLPFEALHTHRTFTTTLRLVGEHPHHHRSPRPLRRVQAVPVHMVDTISPVLLLGCAVVSAAAIVVITFAAFELGRVLFDVARKWIGGF